MPEQQGSRHLPPTAAPIEKPFETISLRFGLGGLDLRVARDLKPGTEGFNLFTNVVHEADGELAQRPGLTAIANLGEDIHSIVRVNQALGDVHEWLVGAGSEIHIVATGGAHTQVDDGYSTDPLTFVSHRPALTGLPWVFIGDSDRNRKISFGGLALPIGITPPASAAAAAAVATQITNICDFDTTDATDLAHWTGVAGFNYPGEDEGDPIETDVPIMNLGTGPTFGEEHIEFVTAPGAVEVTTRAYYSYWTCPLTRNLSVVGPNAASDDDLIHLWIKFSHPDWTDEFRLYLVCSETFNSGVLPGTADDGSNGDFYVKAWRSNDFAGFVTARSGQIDAAETSRIHDIRDQSLKQRKIDDERAEWQDRRAAADPNRAKSFQTGPAREQWVEFGVLGVPLRRGDFLRVGSTSGRDWSTITGIVVFIKTLDGWGHPLAVSLDSSYLFGGYGPDSCEPGAQQFDWRYTHYDPRTGAESNPSPEMSVKLDLLRTAANVTPAANGDAAMRQRFYRRGGSLFEDWYFLGENSSDGGVLVDDHTDDDIVAAGTLELDNDAFVTTVDSNGDAIHNQPLPVIFGPDHDLLFGLGDPWRPGHVYFCKPGRPDSWPPDNTVEVCSPDEQLMNGGIFAGQPFCFSRRGLYQLVPNLTGEATSVTALPTACRKGLIQRWAMAIGRGAIWFVTEDGIYRTTGGAEERISETIQPIFEGQTVEIYAPIDFDNPSEIKLEIHDHDLWFLYRDTDAKRQVMIYSIIYNYWRHYDYPSNDIASIIADEGDTQTAPMLGDMDGNLMYGYGLTDLGVAIEGKVRTVNSDLGRPREDKLLGDIYLDLDRNGTDIEVTTFLNHEAVQNGVQTITDGTDRQRYILDPFGEEPQRARTVALDLAWESSAGGPTLYQAGVSMIPEPDVTNQRVTQWDDLGSADEKYLTGCWLECDTNGIERTILVEYDLGGVISTAATLLVTSAGRHRFAFSWPVVKANQVRIRPGGDCDLWILYKLDWLAQPEPPRIARWDVNFENAWDVYLTGLDLDCNTFGEDKTVEVYLEQTLLETVTVNTPARRVVHITVQPPVRGHLMRFVATDDNPGLLYAHRWHYDEEPSEQTNWNQNYTVAGFMTDKYLKGVVLETDTFGEDKTVTVEVDGEVVETFVVNTDGRKVVETSFPQHLGRVFRIIPTDDNPSRLYQPPQLIFDLEPFALTRWETQEIDHDYALWEVPLYGQVTIKSTADVTLTLVTRGQEDDNEFEDEYVILNTDGTKRKRFVPFIARKGVLFKYTFTSDEPFYLYREESSVKVSLWGMGKSVEVHPFGNDDLDRTRTMTNASLAAARPGGGT